MTNTFTVTQLADRLNVTLPTVRNWARRYALHLSAGANPPHGAQRTFTERDVNVLAYVGQCVDAKMSHAAIELALASTTFGDILEKTALETTEIASRSFSTIDAPLVAPVPTSTVDYAPVLADLAVLVDRRHDETVKRLTSLERQRHGNIMLAVGMTIGAAIVVLALLLLRLL